MHVCAIACRNLRHFGCGEGWPIDGGETCYALCQRIESNHNFGLRPACIASAHTMNELYDCKTVRCVRR